MPVRAVPSAVPMLCCVLAVSALSSIPGLSKTDESGRGGWLLDTSVEASKSDSVPLECSPFSRSLLSAFSFGGELEVAVDEESVEEEIDLSEIWRLMAAAFSLSRSY